MEGCRTCLSVSGKQPFGPNGAVYVGRHFRVEHAFQTTIAGWLVIVARRHVEALHELDTGEMAEYLVLLATCIRLQHKLYGPQKEYVLNLHENPAFHHLHAHVVPVPNTLPDEFRGPKALGCLHQPEDCSLDAATLKQHADNIRRQFSLMHEEELFCIKRSLAAQA